jgi:hypothetical protein
MFLGKMRWLLVVTAKIAIGVEAEAAKQVQALA